MRTTLIGLVVGICLLLGCAFLKKSPNKALPSGRHEGEPFFNVQFFYTAGDKNKIAQVKIDQLTINDTLSPINSDYTTASIPIPLLMNEDRATYVFSLKEERDASQLSHQGTLTVSYQRKIFKDINKMAIRAEKLKLEETDFASVQLLCLGSGDKPEQVMGQVSNCNSNGTTFQVFLPQ